MPSKKDLAIEEIHEKHCGCQTDYCEFLDGIYTGLTEFLSYYIYDNYWSGCCDR